MKIYVNGSLTNSRNVTGTITVPSSSTILAIGTNPNGSNAGGGYFGGKIYSIRLYKDALTESEVLQNYNIDKRRFNIN